MLTLTSAFATDGVDRTGPEAAERRWEELKRRYAPDLARPEAVVDVVRRPAKPLEVIPIGNRAAARPEPASPAVSDSPARWRPSAVPLRGAADAGFLAVTEEDSDGEDQEQTDRDGEDEEAADDGPTVKERIEEATRLRPLSAIVPSFDYAPAGADRCNYLCPPPADCPEGEEAATRCPEELDLPADGMIVRVFAPTQYAWAASNLSHNPLYFEDASLERYGQLYPEWVQPFASMGLFGVQLAAMPYQLAIDPACSCVTPLGFYRPGEAAPCVKKAIPWNGRAAAEAAAVYTGLIFLVP